MTTHPGTLSELLAGHPFADDDPVVESGDGPLSLGELRARVAVLCAPPGFSPARQSATS